MEARDLTRVEAIGQQQFEDYSESYAALGHIMMDLPLIHKLPRFLADLLPHPYRAVSLGSGDGRETEAVVAACQAQEKEGQFLSVDPFISRAGVLKMTSEEFVGSCESDSLDLILLKCSFHFNKNQSTFFRQAHRCLKPSGKMVVVQMGDECRLPWTPALQDNFLKLLLLAPDFIPPQLFRWEVKKEGRACRLNKALFREFVKSRGWSNLLTHPQADIEDCLRHIDQLQELPEAFICVWRIVVEKQPLEP
jgi:SAM-dependent methyltransferase